MVRRVLAHGLVHSVVVVEVVAIDAGSFEAHHTVTVGARMIWPWPSTATDLMTRSGRPWASLPVLEHEAAGVIRKPGAGSEMAPAGRRNACSPSGCRSAFAAGSVRAAGVKR
jgi:hypothetical protein